MPPKKRDLPSQTKPVSDKRELKDAFVAFDNEDDGDDSREARRYLIARAKELGERLPLGWEEDGTLNPGWDANLKSGEPKFKPLREGD